MEPLLPSSLLVATGPGHLPPLNSAPLLGEEHELLTMVGPLSRYRCCGGILR